MARDINTYTRTIGGVRVTAICPSGAGSKVSTIMRTAINDVATYGDFIAALKQLPAAAAVRLVIEERPYQGCVFDVTPEDAPNVNLD